MCRQPLLDGRRAGEATMPGRKPAGARPDQLATSAGRRRAAGIYGAIVTAALLTAAGGTLQTAAMAFSVLITLVVYWLAEQYAEILGEQATAGRLPTRRQVRAGLAGSWPMVSSSFAPLIALLLARLAGASAPVAAYVGIAAAIVLLTFHGWTAGRAAQLRGWRLVGTTAVAAALGLMLVTLKNLVIVHLH
jgi:hypothetical protein